MVLGGDSSPAAIHVHCVGTHSCLGRATTWEVGLWLLRDWHIRSLPHLTCLAQPIPLLVLPSFHLSWGCFTPLSQRAFCCQAWQDWLQGYSSAGTLPGPWVWAKMGLTLHRLETNPTPTYLSSDFHEGDDTSEDAMWRNASLASLQSLGRLCELFYMDELDWTHPGMSMPKCKRTH